MVRRNEYGPHSKVSEERAMMYVRQTRMSLMIDHGRCLSFDYSLDHGWRRRYRGYSTCQRGGLCEVSDWFVETAEWGAG